MSADAERLVVLVCGGRGFGEPFASSSLGNAVAEVLWLTDALDRLHARRRIALLIHGACPSGADRVAGQWAEMRGVPCQPCRADWGQYGRAAGPVRNRAMLDAHAPQLVVAFPGGRGTADMVRAATKRGVQVWRPLPPASLP
jgi:hypothetical protein